MNHPDEPGNTGCVFADHAWFMAMLAGGNRMYADGSLRWVTANEMGRDDTPVDIYDESRTRYRTTGNHNCYYW